MAKLKQTTVVGSTPTNVTALGTDKGRIDVGMNSEKQLMRFNTERYWTLEQGGASATASLDLVSSNIDKNFRVIGPAKKEGTGVVMRVSDANPTQVTIDGKQVYHTGNASVSAIQKTASTSTSSSVDRNNYTKIASIDVSEARYTTCSGFLDMMITEASPTFGTLNFVVRCGDTINTSVAEFRWTYLSEEALANRVHAVKTGASKYDIYYQPPYNWDTTTFTLRSCVREDLITMYSRQPFVKSITPTMTSVFTPTGSVKGRRRTVDTGTNAGWYRIAQTTSADQGNTLGQFFIQADVSGKRSNTIFTAGVLYGSNPTLVQLSHTKNTGNGITQARIVYHETYSGNRAYLEVYDPDAVAKTLQIEIAGTESWTLISPSGGSIPAGYKVKDITFVPNKIVGDLQGTVNGHTIEKSVPKDALFTWRGIQNNLTSTSTTESLSAAQGKWLNDNKAAVNHGNHIPKTEVSSNNKFLRCDNTWVKPSPEVLNCMPADKTFRQMGRVIEVPTTGNGTRNFWFEIATITLGSGYANCSGRLFFTSNELQKLSGTAYFKVRTGVDVTIADTYIMWENLHDHTYAKCLCITKVSNGVFKIWLNLDKISWATTSIYTDSGASTFQFNSNIVGTTTEPQNIVVTSHLGGNVGAVNGFTIGKSVPSDAVFTDTKYSAATTSASGLMSSTDKTKLDGIATGANNYTHPTGAGNNHIPSGGGANQYLKYSASGTAVWSGLPGASTSAQGIVQLNNATNSTSTSQAATAAAVKAAYDKANHSHSYLPLSGGTVTGELHANKGVIAYDASSFTNGATVGNYFKIQAFKDYGTGTANFWFNGKESKLVTENINELSIPGKALSDYKQIQLLRNDYATTVGVGKDTYGEYGLIARRHIKTNQLQGRVELSTAVRLKSTYPDFCAFDDKGYFTPTMNNALALGKSDAKWSTVYCSSCTSSSDEKLKENIRYVDSPKARFYKSTDITTQEVYDFFKKDLRMAIFDMKTTGDEHPSLLRGHTSKDKFGFIAQDIMNTKVGAYFVNRGEDFINKDGKKEAGLLGFDLGDYINVVAAGLQQAIKKIETLEQRIAELENK